MPNRSDRDARLVPAHACAPLPGHLCRWLLVPLIALLLQTFTIMGQTISRNELPGADMVIRPGTPGLSSTDFSDRHLAVLEGEKAVAAILPELKAKLEKLRGEWKTIP